MEEAIARAEEIGAHPKLLKVLEDIPKYLGGTVSSPQNYDIGEIEITLYPAHRLQAYRCPIRGAYVWVRLQHRTARNTLLNDVYTFNFGPHGGVRNISYRAPLCKGYTCKKHMFKWYVRRNLTISVLKAKAELFK